MEEAFLKLCTKRGISEDAVKDDAIAGNESHFNENFELQERSDEILHKQNINNNNNDHLQNSVHQIQAQNTTSQNDSSTENISSFKRKKYAWPTLRALFTKNFLQMKRQPA